MRAYCRSRVGQGGATQKVSSLRTGWKSNSFRLEHVSYVLSIAVENRVIPSYSLFTTIRQGKHFVPNSCFLLAVRLVSQVI